MLTLVRRNLNTQMRSYKYYVYVTVRCCRHTIFTLQYRELVVVCHVPIRVLSVQKADAFSANGRAGAGSTVGQRMRLGTDDKYLNFNT